MQAIQCQGGGMWISEAGCVENGDKEEKTSKQELRGMEDEERIRR